MSYRSLSQRGLASGSIAPAIALLVAAIGFGASRDFGAFLLGFLILPALALVTVIWIVIAAMAPGRRTGAVAIAAALAVSAVPAFLMANAVRDRVRFVGWALAHWPIDAQTRSDGVLAGWDSWGMAGLENDSYLVVDRSDSISKVIAAERWRRRLGLSCQIVDSQRMAARLYIVTTFNCPFGFDGRRWS